MSSSPPHSRRKGNVIYLTNLFPTAAKPTFGTFVKASSDAMRRLGWDVEVLALPAFGTGLHGYLKFYFVSTLRLLRFNGIVYVHYVSHSALPAMFARQLNRRLRIILHYHGSDAFPEAEEGSWRRTVKGLVCRLANASAMAVVAPSAAFLENLRGRFALNTQHLAVSPSGGIDGTVFSPNSRNERHNDLIFAGRMIAGKGGLTAAKVVRAVLGTRPEAKALLVGEGPERQLMETELGPLIASGSVRFVGLLPPSELAARLSESKIFLFPSSRKGESLGLTWIEAGMCGAVPIVLRNGLTEKLVPKELRGDLVAESEERMIALAKKLLSNPQRRDEIATMLREKLTNEYAQENVAANLEELFRAVLSETYKQ